MSADGKMPAAASRKISVLGGGYVGLSRLETARLEAIFSTNFLFRKTYTKRTTYKKMRFYGRIKVNIVKFNDLMINHNPWLHTPFFLTNEGLDFVF